VNQEDFPPEDFEPRAFFRPQRAWSRDVFLAPPGCDPGDDVFFFWDQKFFDERR
jgi:hypothetical protein